MAKKEEEKKVNYLKYISIVLMIYLLTSGAIYWFSNNINQKALTIQEQRSHLAALNNRDQSYHQLQIDYGQIKDQYREVEQALPSQSNFVAFIVSLEQEAKDNQVNLEIDFPSEPEIEDNKLSFILDVEGNLKNVVKYLKELKRKPYYIEVDSVNLSASGPKNQVAGEITINAGIDETFNPSQISN